MDTVMSSFGVVLDATNQLIVQPHGWTYGKVNCRRRQWGDCAVAPLRYLYSGVVPYRNTVFGRGTRVEAQFGERKIPFWLPMELYFHLVTIQFCEKLNLAESAQHVWGRYTRWKILRNLSFGQSS
jgi:hypothetical protein